MIEWLQKIVDKILFDKPEPEEEEKHYHDWKVVKSTGKTIMDILMDSGFLHEHPSFQIITYDDKKTVDFEYRGQTIAGGFRWYSGYYNDMKIYNKVCMECGECTDEQKQHVDHLRDRIKVIDEYRNREEKEQELIEKMWADNCIGKE